MSCANLGKGLLFTRNQVFYLKSKASRSPSRVYFFSLIFCVYALRSNTYKLSVRKSVIITNWKNWLVKDCRKIKFSPHFFLGIAEDDTCAKFEQNTINSTWVEAQKNFHPLKQNMFFLVKKKSLLRICPEYFIVEPKMMIINSELKLNKQRFKVIIYLKTVLVLKTV